MIRVSLLLCSCLWLLAACASGPHPAMVIASKDFDCPMKDLERHQIFPKKQRIEGCGKAAIYIEGCNGYGADSSCKWVRTPAPP
jgi:hypothetical protein